MEIKEIKKQFKELLDHEVIIPSTSPCSSPITNVCRLQGIKQNHGKESLSITMH